jgi:hypothetical protein
VDSIILANSEINRIGDGNDVLLPWSIAELLLDITYFNPVQRSQLPVLPALRDVQ